MTHPRAHADLAIEFYSDAENKCWVWNKIDRIWVFIAEPRFEPHVIYHVGKEAPTEPPAPMCELAGVQFPMPVQKPLARGQDYWVATPGATNHQEYDCWDEIKEDYQVLELGLIHLTKTAAIQHGLALEAANKQTVERAKEKMK